MNRTTHFLVLFGFLPSLIACSNALAENKQVNETKAFLTISLDTNRIDNSKIVNPEGQLLLSFEAYPTFEHPISLVQLKSVKSLKDLMRAFPAEYIEEYMEVRLSSKGKTCLGKGEQLNAEQKKMIQALTVSDKFRLEVDFKSRSTLNQQLEAKTMDFEITVVPTQQAFYEAGETAMNTYFREQSLQMAQTFALIGLADIELAFTINAEGKAEKTHLEECSPHKELTDFLIKTVENMPAWMPALNEKGEKICQDFYLKIIALDNC
jgi:hypothetical protein